MIKLIKTDGDTDQYVFEENDDITTVIAPIGSTAFNIDTSEVYMKKGNGEWKKFKEVGLWILQH